MTVSSPLISIDQAACERCWRCVRRCPVHAIKVSEDGGVEIMVEKCVACGLCVLECPHGAVVVRNDGPSVDAVLSGPRPVVALLSAEFAAALHPRDPGQVERALQRAGFHAVETTLLGEEAVALAYEQRHSAANGHPIIRSTCPVVNEYICRYHPALVSALAPVQPPYAAQAQLIKDAYPDDVAVVYVSPCYARKDEAATGQFGGVVDAAIDFRELVRALESIPAGSDGAGEVAVSDRRPEPMKEISLTDGYPRSTLTSAEMAHGEVKVVRGLRELEDLLAAIEAGEAAPLIVDALNCEGCLDGPAVNPSLSLFAKRDIEVRERRSRVRATVSTRQILRHLPALDLRRSFKPDPLQVEAADDARIEAELARAGLAGDAALDCSACGFDTCHEFAEAVCRGESDWQVCPPVRERRLAAEMAELEESATLDSLTGLWNRRVFADRLHEEFARQSRYGGPLSLLMLDVDYFKGINDRYGHLSGDVVLATVARTIRETLRTTDVPVRYGGDEFAIILPQTGKTEAFAVAEKLRIAVVNAAIKVSNGAEDHSVDIHVSIGVASTSEHVAEPLELLEAADRALYQAKALGRNQVRLAPG